MRSLFVMLFSLSLIGCGEIKVTGDVRVTHAVEIDSIEQLLDIACGLDTQCKQDLLYAILADIALEEENN